MARVPCGLSLRTCGVWLQTGATQHEEFASFLRSEVSGESGEGLHLQAPYLLRSSHVLPLCASCVSSPHRPQLIAKCAALLKTLRAKKKDLEARERANELYASGCPALIMWRGPSSRSLAGHVSCVCVCVCVAAPALHTEPHVHARHTKHCTRLG